MTADTAELVRGAAFRRLLRTGRPASSAQLAAELDKSEADIRAVVDELLGRGWLRGDDHDHVVGASGLSIHPDRHEIVLDGRQFWTWCAYDFLGIFAALGASGHALSSSPDDPEPLLIRFQDGQPEPSSLVLLLPDEDLATSCTSVYDQWCPNSNLFRTPAAAANWATAHGVTATVLELSEGAVRGAAYWRPLVAG